MGRTSKKRSKRRRFIDDAASESGDGGAASSDEPSDEEQANEEDLKFINDEEEEIHADDEPGVRISRREKRLTKKDLELVLENVGLLHEDAKKMMRNTDKTPRQRLHRSSTTVYKDSDESGACSSDEGFIESESSEETDGDDESTPTPVPPPRHRKKSTKKMPPPPPVPATSVLHPKGAKDHLPPLSKMTASQLSDFADFYSCDAQDDDSPVAPAVVRATAPLPTPTIVIPTRPAVVIPTRPSYIMTGPLAPAATGFATPATSGARKKNGKPLAPPGRARPTPPTRSVAPIFNKGHRPLPQPKKGADAKKQGCFPDQVEGIYVRNGQLLYKDKDGKESLRKWDP